MSSPKKQIDWRGVWADALKGVGEGLLKLDGSRAAQAALAGFDAFDDAQRRRRDQCPACQLFGGSPSDYQSGAEADDTGLSQLRRAAFFALTGVDPSIWDGGQQDAQSFGTMPQSPDAPVAPYVKPLSADPYDAWRGPPNLPRGMSGQAYPGYRR